MIKINIDACGTGKIVVKGNGENFIVENTQQNDNHNRKNSTQHRIGIGRGNNTAEKIITDIGIHTVTECGNSDTYRQCTAGNQGNSRIIQW